MRSSESEAFESFPGNDSRIVYTVNQCLKTVREKGGRIHTMGKDSERGKWLIYKSIYICYIESLSFTLYSRISVVLSIILKNIFAHVRPPGMIRFPHSNGG